MAEYTFTLELNFPDREALQDENRHLGPNFKIERLCEGGCDDALIDIGKQVCIALDFTRASSAFKAVSSAISNVKTAIPNAILIEAARLR
jgi:hypothetical protein